LEGPRSIGEWFGQIPDHSCTATLDHLYLDVHRRHDDHDIEDDDDDDDHDEEGDDDNDDFDGHREAKRLRVWKERRLVSRTKRMMDTSTLLTRGLHALTALRDFEIELSYAAASESPFIRQPLIMPSLTHLNLRDIQDYIPDLSCCTNLVNLKLEWCSKEHGDDQDNRDATKVALRVYQSISTLTRLWVLRLEAPAKNQMYLPVFPLSPLLLPTMPINDTITSVPTVPPLNGLRHLSLLEWSNDLMNLVTIMQSLPLLEGLTTRVPYNAPGEPLTFPLHNIHTIHRVMLCSLLFAVAQIGWILALCLAHWPMLDTLHLNQDHDPPSRNTDGSTMIQVLQSTNAALMKLRNMIPPQLHQRLSTVMDKDLTPAALTMIPTPKIDDIKSTKVEETASVPQVSIPTTVQQVEVVEWSDPRLMATKLRGSSLLQCATAPHLSRLVHHHIETIGYRAMDDTLLGIWSCPKIQFLAGPISFPFQLAWARQAIRDDKHYYDYGHHHPQIDHCRSSDGTTLHTAKVLIIEPPKTDDQLMSFMMASNGAQHLTDLYWAHSLTLLPILSMLLTESSSPTSISRVLLPSLPSLVSIKARDTPSTRDALVQMIQMSSSTLQTLLIEECSHDLLCRIVGQPGRPAANTIKLPAHRGPSSSRLWHDNNNDDADHEGDEDENRNHNNYTDDDGVVSCALCYGHDDDDNNPFLICDGPCDQSFHLHCKGLIEVPTSQWYVSFVTTHLHS
jgi:hypothetical protein